MTSLQADAFFDFDKYFIREDAKPELDRIAEVMIADTQTQFLVWGFTDTVGTAEYNQGLSERRANAVADYLEGRGVSRDRMVIQGFGKTNLAVPTPDQTPEPRNRRVEIRRRWATPRATASSRGRGLRAAPFFWAQSRPRPAAPGWPATGPTAARAERA